MTTIVKSKIIEKIKTLNDVINDQNEELAKKELEFKKAIDEIERLKNIVEMSKGFLPDVFLKAASDPSITIVKEKHSINYITGKEEEKNKRPGLNEIMSENL